MVVNILPTTHALMINILRHNVSENIDVYMKNPSNLWFLSFLETDLVPLLTALAAEVGHRGGGAVALKAQLDVAGEVVLTCSGSRPAIHAKGAQAVAGRLGELHLAEGTERRHDGLTHVLQHRLTSSVQSGESGAGTKGGRRPGGSRNSVGQPVRARRGVDLRDQRAHVDVVANVTSVHLGSTIEDRGHLYIPELEKNS